MTEDGKTADTKISAETAEKQYHAASKNDGVTPLPKIDFSMFMFSLNSSVLVNLGLLEDPVSGGTMKNLAVAKQTIDILGMLQEKTRGNLTRDEEEMLKHILYELRMMYVKEVG
jgi:hypothetical protein